MSLLAKRKLTPRMIAANRSNARKSTGPRTPEGKERSRMNALKHGNRSEIMLGRFLDWFGNYVNSFGPMTEPPPLSLDPYESAYAFGRKTPITGVRTGREEKNKNHFLTSEAVNSLKTQGQRRKTKLKRGGNEPATNHDRTGRLLTAGWPSRRSLRARIRRILARDSARSSALRGPTSPGGTAAPEPK